MGIKTYVVRYGSEAGRTPEGEEQLSALVTSGGTAVVDPMNPSASPWNWVDAERTTVELYGQSCTAFKTNRRTSIVVEFGCPAVTVPVI